MGDYAKIPYLLHVPYLKGGCFLIFEEAKVRFLPVFGGIVYSYGKMKYGVEIKLTPWL